MLEGFGPDGWGFEEKAGEWIGMDPEEEKGWLTSGGGDWTGEDP